MQNKTHRRNLLLLAIMNFVAALVVAPALDVTQAARQMAAYSQYRDFEVHGVIDPTKLAQFRAGAFADDPGLAADYVSGHGMRSWVDGVGSALTVVFLFNGAALSFLWWKTRRAEPGGSGKAATK